MGLFLQKTHIKKTIFCKRDLLHVSAVRKNKYLYLYAYIYMCMYVYVYVYTHRPQLVVFHYVVATISRLFKIMGLFLQKSHIKKTIFCKRDL